MLDYRKVLQLYFEGVSQRTISASTGHSRNTVSEIVRRAKQLDLKQLDDIMTSVWLAVFSFQRNKPLRKAMPRWIGSGCIKSYKKKKVTLALLHHEYATESRQGGKIPYAYRTFCEKYGQYAKKYNLTMPIRRKPGEIMETDWAGRTLYIQDRHTGESIPAYVFVASLPYSQMSYVEAFLDMTSPNWLIAHTHAFEYFGSVPETTVPDNL